MKYMLNGRMPSLMRLTVGLTLLMLVAFWATNALLYFAHMDLTPQSVARYYLGSDEDFSMPRTYGAMLEVTHAHLAMMAVVLLLLTHLAIFLPWRLGARVALTVTAFVSAVLGEGGGWLVRFVSPRLAAVKIAGFVGLELSLLILILGLAGWMLGPARQNGLPEGDGPTSLSPTSAASSGARGST